MSAEIRLVTTPKKTQPRTIYESGGSLYFSDSTFWDILNTTFPSTTSAGMTGYETFAVKYTASAIGNIIFSKYSFDNGDGSTRGKYTSNIWNTSYLNPTVIGKPGSETRIASSIHPSLTAFTSTGVQYITGIDNGGVVDILERWPTTQAYASAANNNGAAIFSEDRIVYGHEPLIVKFIDASVARTYPISAWYADYGDGTTDSHIASSSSEHPANSIVQHNFFNKTYQRANTYWAKFYTVADSGTESANVEIGGTLVRDVSARIDVYPTNPDNNFYLISGESVPSTYTASSPTPATPVTTNGNFISGYSPNLTVTFQASCTPHSFPISSYRWNFGDVFNAVNSNQQVIATKVLSGFDNWTTDKSNHYITYKYMFPGLYNVSIRSYTSADPNFHPEYEWTNSSPVCSKNLLVYVEEILPQTVFGMSSSSGGPFSPSITFNSSPMTVYFNASGTIPGSFQIGKMSWDFGDGTKYDVLSSITKPYPEIVTVEHTYTRYSISDQSIFNVGVTAYAFNTESTNSYSITGIGPLQVTPLSSLTGVDIPQHLLDASLFGNNDLLVVFEGQQKKTFNYLISTESNLFRN